MPSPTSSTTPTADQEADRLLNAGRALLEDLDLAAKSHTALLKVRARRFAARWMGRLVLMIAGVGVLLAAGFRFAESLVTGIGSLIGGPAWLGNLIGASCLLALPLIAFRIGCLRAERRAVREAMDRSETPRP